MVGLIFLPGRVNRVSFGSTLRTDAVKVLKRRLSEISAGRRTAPDTEKATFEDLTQKVLDDSRGTAACCQRGQSRRIRSVSSEWPLSSLTMSSN